MDIEAFPAIENFQKLPKQVIVKGAPVALKESAEPELRGIVINNIGHTIKNVRAHVILFDEKKIPLQSTSMMTDPETLPQGGIGNFVIRLNTGLQGMANFHLYATWKFDEQPG